MAEEPGAAFPLDANGRDAAEIPHHVAIIMDGNGRWAEDKGLPRLEGHRAGVEKIRSVLGALARRRVKFVTIYAFSTENWNRPDDEVEGIMSILRDVIHQETRALHEQGVRVVHLGRSDRLLPDLREAVSQAQDLTQHNTAITLCVAFDYGGRSEIVEAVRQIVRSGAKPEEVDEELLSSHLYTHDIPDPDLIIRTGGEYRLSNFLLWQSAYSEFYTTTVPWPELSATHVEEAICAYGRRKRKFGALTPDP